MASIDDLRRQADALTDESLASTRRMVALAVDTEAIAARTLETLGTQRETIVRSGVKLSHLDDNLSHADRITKRMQCCCSIL